MDNELYSYSPIVERPSFEFPDGKSLAFYLGLNIEHFRVDIPAKGDSVVPSPTYLGRRDYGTRVGFWRLLDLFDSFQLRVSAITNSDVCSRYPQIIEAGVEREWAFIAHGQTNSIMQSGMEEDAERNFLATMIAEFDAVLPTRPKGWLGPGLSETFATPTLLRELGFTYLLDWCCDDQPFPLAVPGMISVPYSLEVNDISRWNNGALTGPNYERIVLDQFEGLLAESITSRRVMALPLHTFVAGQPYLCKYLERVLNEICSHNEVWFCTSDDIAEHYLATVSNEVLD